MHRQARKNLLNMMTAIALAAAAILVFLPAAQAAPGYATANVNVRSGPGTNYAVVDTLVRNQQVDVQQCQGNWCYVVKPGRHGWVSASYLAPSAPQQPAPPPSQPNNQPNFGFGFSIGPDGPSFGFGFGTGNQRPPFTQPQPPVQQACFYSDIQYRGQSFCLERGQSYNLGQFSSGIGSIRNQAGLNVQVCSRFGFNNCRTYTTNAGNLGNFGNGVYVVRVR